MNASLVPKILKLTLTLFANLIFLLIGIMIHICAREAGSRLRLKAFISMLWAKVMCRLLGIHILIEGDVRDQKPFFTVSNHVSYVDIMALASVRPSVFIAKHEIRTWPLLGWLAGLGGTIFIDRTSKKAAWGALFRIEKAISYNVNTVLFPEGTTGDGAALKDFRTLFFDIPARLRSGIQPISVKYIRKKCDNAYELDETVAWHGDMQLIPHLWRLFGMKRINVVLYFNPAINYMLTERTTAETRKLLSSVTCEIIRDGLSRPVACA